MRNSPADSVSAFSKPETRISSPWAAPPMRAARLTCVPKKSSASLMASPVWSPMRTRSDSSLEVLRAPALVRPPAIRTRRHTTRRSLLRRVLPPWPFRRGSLAAGFGCGTSRRRRGRGGRWGGRRYPGPTFRAGRPAASLRRRAAGRSRRRSSCRGRRSCPRRRGARRASRTL